MSATLVHDRRDAIDSTAALLMLMLTLSWGFNGVAQKLSNVGFSPMFVTMMRSAIACGLVCLWCAYRRIPVFERDGTLWPGIIAGLLFGGEFALIFFGLDYTSVARAALMINIMPFWVLIGAHFFLGERMTAQALVGLVLSFGGLVLVFSDKLSLPGPDAIWGDVLCLLAGILWAATTIVIKGTRLVAARAEKILLYQLAVSALMIVPILPFVTPLIREVNALAISSLLFQGIFIAAFTYLLWFWLMRRYPAGALTSFAFLTPAFGVLLGGLLLDEPLTVRILLALGLIVIGLIVVNRPVRRPAASPAKV